MPRALAVARRGAPAALLLGAAFALGGCLGIAAPIAAAGVETASYVNTEKFVADHVISALSGEDCSAGNLADGDSYCTDQDGDGAAVAAAAAPARYCYRSLGKISCYATPDPYNDGAQPVQ